MLRLKGGMTTPEFLQIVGERLRTSLPLKDFMVLAHLYADCAGIKKERQKRALKAQREPRKNPTEPTMTEMIMQLEKESKNG